jgi:hypothetical protein
MRPLIHSGTPPGCTGRGSHQIRSNSRSSPEPPPSEDGEDGEYDAGPGAHILRSTSSVRSSAAPRSSNRSPFASYSSRCHPTPTPSSSRPLDTTSSVAAALASVAGRRSGAMRMAVASRTRRVVAAIAVSRVSGSGHCPSGPVGNAPPS